ncbi:hypothetical protein CRG98_003789 [Punica granatum]|uniref:Uncharacterized protein n=1 Tax=Punica granatum TaxID=22663 RepID=A0A2I0L5B2_PUNGR|nr:hypothetical protein CRG98_003789 [Punica granatum]
MCSPRSWWHRQAKHVYPYVHFMMHARNIQNRGKETTQNPNRVKVAHGLSLEELAESSLTLVRSREGLLFYFKIDSQNQLQLSAICMLLVTFLLLFVYAGRTQLIGRIALGVQRLNHRSRDPTSHSLSAQLNSVFDLFLKLTKSKPQLSRFRLAREIDHHGLMNRNARMVNRFLDIWAYLSLSFSIRIV